MRPPYYYWTPIVRNKIILKTLAVFLVAFYGLVVFKVEQLHQYTSNVDVPIPPSVDNMMVSFGKKTPLTGHHAKDDHPVDNHRSQTPLLIPHSVGKKEKLQIKLDRIYQMTGRPYQGGALWELSDYVPSWMKEYFDWHRQERQKLTKDNWKAYYYYGDDKKVGDSPVKLMVMQCIKYQDAKCGGTADRLKSFVYLVREAYEMKRLLLIYWTMPARIEEFLVPPVGGIDWRVPQWLRPMLYNVTIGRKLFRDVERFADYRNSSVPLFRTRLQSLTGFAEYYDALSAPGEASFADVYHDVWRIFFRPSPPVAEWIEHEMTNLQPGKYAAAHVRALYGRIVERPDDQAIDIVHNAINCASQLRPGGPFFFASDHTFSTRAALDYGAQQHVSVITRQHESQPLHVDKAPNLTERQPKEFYDTFVDLYLMGMSKCLTYNRGGFGHWALLIGYDANCYVKQKTSKAGIAVRCNWTDAVAAIDHGVSMNKEPVRRVPLFLDPMK